MFFVKHPTVSGYLSVKLLICCHQRRVLSPVIYHSEVSCLTAF